jgi:PAS domain S-box-containing protein
MARTGRQERAEVSGKEGETRPRVIVADDNAIAARLLSHTLEGEGYRVEVAGDGAEALAAARRDSPDLIISDVLMPGMDGFALCRAVKADPLLNTIPVVFYSETFVQPRDRELALASGASSLILKSATTEQFLADIHQVLDEYRQAQLEVPTQPSMRDETLERMHRERLIDKLAAKVRELESEKQALAVSEAKFRQVVETVPGAIVIHRLPDLTPLFISPQIESMTGYEPSVLQSTQGWLRIVHPEDRERLTSVLKALSRDGEQQQMEVRIFRKGSEEPRWLEVRVSIRRNEEGIVDALVAVLTDTTERKQAEETVHELARLPEETPNPVLRTDGSGKLIYANRAAGRLLDDSCKALLPEVSGQLCPFITKALDGAAQAEVDLRVEGRTYSCVVVPVVSRGYANVYGRDVTERVESEQAVRRLNRALRTLSRGNEVLVRAASEQELLDGVCGAVVNQGGYRMAWVALGGTPQTMHAGAAAGHEAGYLSMKPETLRAGPAARAIEGGESVLVQDIASDADCAALRQQAIERGYRAAVAVPLCAGGERLGALTIYAGEVNAFDVKEVRLLEELAGDLGYGMAALRTKQAHDLSAERLRRALFKTIETVALTIEKRDPYTAGHQQRVAALATAIGERMGLDKGRLEGLRMGGLIHDIGKIYIPAEILNRPGRLTEAEFGLIKTHSQVGYDIMKGVEFPWPIGEMILQHHERLDGSGYPEGLSGNQIILEARILAVADVVEAIMSHRPYRPALGIENATAEIRKGRGDRYDPEVVDACIEVLKEEGFDFDRLAAEAG